jgi:hypothetical protein
MLGVSIMHINFRHCIRELSGDDEIQHEEDLQILLDVLKIKYHYRDEMNKKILYDNEIKIFAETYNVIDAYPILARDDVIYIWYRTDEAMMHGGCNIREALINFLFHEERLCYINEDDYRLISKKEAREKGIRCYIQRG